MTLTQPQIELPGRYRVLRHIATGGMATVYAARDELLGREVAVKVLSEALGADASARERFTREARAAAKVSDHPHVVTIYDIGETDEERPAAFIVMELLRGGTVNDRLKAREPIPHAQALAWLRDAAGALDAAHAAGMVHRDIKPANLLLDANGTLKVADFGIATLASEAPLTQTGQVVGTAAYLSPEQARGRPATAASDRYALGVVAYELLTGRRPFPEAAPAAQALAHVEADPPPPSTVAPGLPPHVDAVMASALAKDPGARPASAELFVSALDGALGPTAATGVAQPQPRFRRETPVPAPIPFVPRTPRPAPVRSEPRRRSRLAAAAAVAALLLVLGAGIAALAGAGGSSQRSARRAPTPAAQHRTRPQPTVTAAQTTPPPTSAPAAPAPSDPSAVEAQAHALIDQGRYADAVGLLRGMVGGCDVQTTDPCAYAWYDLGHALRLSGDPAGAIPVLEHRLANPDQQGAVQAELDLARQQAGQTPPQPAQGHGQAKGHDKHGGGD